MDSDTDNSTFKELSNYSDYLKSMYKVETPFSEKLVVSMIFHSLLISTNFGMEISESYFNINFDDIPEILEVSFNLLQSKLISEKIISNEIELKI